MVVLFTRLFQHGYPVVQSLLELLHAHAVQLADGGYHTKPLRADRAAASASSAAAGIASGIAACSSGPLPQLRSRGNISRGANALGVRSIVGKFARAC